MIVSTEYIYHNLEIGTIYDVIKNVGKELNEKIIYDDFCKIIVKGNIEFIELINIKTKNVTVTGHHLMHRAKTIIASKGRYKIDKISEVSITIEYVINKHVIETNMKTQIPMMKRKFFKKNAENRDCIYNYCKNPYKNSIGIVLIAIFINYPKTTLSVLMIMISRTITII